MLREVTAPAVIAVGLLQAGPCAAWSYKEHVQITHAALVEACTGSGLAATLPCSSPHAMACFAHLVAVAADHAGSPERLLDTQRRGEYLASKTRDCGDIANWAQGRQGELAPELPLGSGTLARQLEYARLAGANFTHFQPESADSWRKGFKAHVLDGKAGADTQQAMVVKAAFALHFLQDSFAAGHNGLERRLPLRQNYAQAYHDDINRHGLVLANDRDEWLAYGDEALDAASNYLVVPALAADEAAALAGPLRRRLAAVGAEQTIDDEDLLAFLKGEPAMRILSSPLADDDRHRFDSLLCTLIDNCRKAELVLVKGEFRLEGRDCQPVWSDGAAAQWRCDDTRRFVVRASTHAVRALLLQLARTEGAQAEFALADAMVPRRHRYYARTTAATRINAEPLEIPLSPRQDNARQVDLTYANWTYAVHCRSRTGASASRCGPAFGLNNAQDPQLGGHLHGGVMFGIVDTRGKWLNWWQASFAYSRPDWRVYHAVLGISPKVSFGVDGLTVPRERRAYVGLGLSFDAHLGKRVIFIDIDHARLNRPLDGERTRRGLMVGLKWGVINLQQRARQPAD